MRGFSQLIRIWQALSLAQRVSTAVAALSVVALLFYFSYWRTEKDFSPIFTAMSPEDAAAVVEKLKETGSDFRVADNGASVLVPSAKVAETRLQMAGAGLPRSGRIGFELFDRSSLGSSDFAEQVNFRRALEGELERSIRSIAEVEMARVHITFPKDSVFLESRLPAKASVLLRTRRGAELRGNSVKAIVHLVASAVQDLAPEQVTVTDHTGNLLTRQKDAHDDSGITDEQLGYRRKLESDLTEKVNNTLTSLVGPDRCRVGVSVECDFTSGEQSEELYDPEKTVMLTTQKSEETGSSTSAGGVPGTASALPRPVPRTGTGTLGLVRRTENVTYQPSRTVRRTKLPHGTIRRISASVLLDQESRWEKRSGRYERVSVTPAADRLKAIHEVVAATLGLVPDRGDVLVVQSLPFETVDPGTPPVSGEAVNGSDRKPDVWVLVAAGGAVVLLVSVGGFVFLRRRRRIISAAGPAMPGGVPQVSPGEPAEATEAIGAGESEQKLLAEGTPPEQALSSSVSSLREIAMAEPAVAATTIRRWLREADS